MTEGKNIHQKKKIWNASLTVEASFVMVLTLLVLMTILVTTFYVHDRAVLQGAACEAASAAVNSVNTEEGKKETARKMAGITAARLLGSRELSGTSASGETSASASWQAVYPVPGLIAGYYVQNRLPIQVSWTMKRHHPADAIRKIRGIGKLLEEAIR